MLCEEREGKVFFRYEVDNRQFSTYSTDIKVSVWHGQEKVRDLVSQPMLIAAFDKGQLEWGVDTGELVPESIPLERVYEFTVIVKRGEIERRVIVHVNPLAYPMKVVPVPSR